MLFHLHPLMSCLPPDHCSPGGRLVGGLVPKRHGQVDESSQCCHPCCFNKLYNDIKASDVVLRCHLRPELNTELLLIPQKLFLSFRQAPSAQLGSVLIAMRTRVNLKKMQINVLT